MIPSRQLLIVQFADAERRYREERFLSLALGDSSIETGTETTDGDGLPGRAP